MGYTTTFEGSISIQPALSQEEIEFLHKFTNSRRMDRSNGPYFVDGSDRIGQGHDPDVIDHNRPPPGQPGLWCQWETSNEGDFLQWDGGEKFYSPAEWMKYIIDHFIGPNPIAAAQLPFLRPHQLNGEIQCQGEENGDFWYLVVEDSKVYTTFPIPGPLTEVA